MSLLRLVSIALLATTLMAKARLGESIQQCDSRYGKPSVNEGTNRRDYLAANNQYFITCEFNTQGKCIYITIKSATKGVLLTDTEIHEFLKKNSENDSFVLSSRKAKKFDAYQEKDSGRSAFFCTDSAEEFYGELWISSKEFNEKTNKSIEEDKKALDKL